MHFFTWILFNLRVIRGFKFWYEKEHIFNNYFLYKIWNNNYYSKKKLKKNFLWKDLVEVGIKFIS